MKVRVAVNGYGTIGKRVAEAITKQPDMELVGVVKTKPDYAAFDAVKKGFKLYTLEQNIKSFKEHGLEVHGTVEDLLRQVDVVIDATPGGTGAKYKPVYESAGVRAVFQGGEKADVAEVSFNALCNFGAARGKRYVRVVSCNTTGLLRSLHAITKVAKPRKVFAVIVRRGADPREAKRGPINAIVLDPPTIPSHHGPDVRTVLPDVDITTVAVAVPTTLMHVHIVRARLERGVRKEEVVEAFASTPRIVLVSSSKGFKATSDVVEFARDIGRKRYDIPELVVWYDSISVESDEVTWIQAVHQESIVVPENVDAVRAVMFKDISAETSISITDSTLGVRRGWLI